MKDFPDFLYLNFGFADCGVRPKSVFPFLLLASVIPSAKVYSECALKGKGRDESIFTIVIPGTNLVTAQDSI